MPGLKLLGAALASRRLVMGLGWRQLFLLLCLTCATVQSWAQATDGGKNNNDPATSNEVDAILSGRDITLRVLGGDDSEPGDWPSMVALVSPGISTVKNRFFCGGTIIAERWVMTAAHCLFDTIGVQSTPEDILVIAGIHDLVEDAGLDEVVVTNIIIHPDYVNPDPDNDDDSPVNDIALLELANALDAPVGELFVGESEDYTGTIGHIVGWGATRFLNENAAEYPSTQQEAPVPLVSLATCNSPVSYDGLIAVTQLCAGYAKGQIDTCAGDSGGPLYIVEDGRIVQVGITSFGNGCGQENFYGIYTNVSHFIPWLSNYVTVPEQSSELVSSRENGGIYYNSVGAISPFYLLLLVGVSLFLRLAGMACRRHGGTLWRSCKSGKNLLVAPIALFMSACTVPTIDAQANATSTAKPTTPEINSMSEVHTLMLNGSSLRSGVDGLQLGATHEELVSSLTKSHWQKPECESGKTALRGTGRLFQTDHCSVETTGTVGLHGRQVRKLDLYLLDKEVVRIDVALATPSASELSGAAGVNLSDLLNDTYQQSGVALPGEKQEDVWLWKQQDDQIRWYPERSIHFIDGRLESRLAALYEFNPPFNFD